MKKQFLFIAVLCLSILASCSFQDQELEEQINVKLSNGRMKFDSQDEFNQLVNELFSKSNSEIIDWAQSNNVDALLLIEEKTRLAAIDFPPAFKAIMNSDGEYQVGDAIFWYHGGYKHVAYSEKELAEIKDSPELNGNKSEFTISTQPITSSNERTSLGANALDAKHQREFNYLNNSGNRRKYVHELMTYSESSNNQLRSYLYLRIKLEYRTRGRWKGAGEQRDVVLNLSGSATVTYLKHFSGVTEYQNFPINASSSMRRSGDIYILLGSLSAYSSHSPFWSVEFGGVISHSIVGDVVTNKWDNQGSPLW